MTDAFDYVFDSSAVLSIVLQETDRSRAVDVLRRARDGHTRLAIPFMAIMESEYQLIRRFSVEDGSRFRLTAGEWPATVFHSNENWGHEAAIVKARGGLSLADAWIAALALLLDAQLVHKDKEFDGVPGLRSVRL